MKPIGRPAADQPAEIIEFVPKRELDRAQQENERLRQEKDRLQKENERLKQETERLRRELEAALRASKRQAAPHSHRYLNSGRSVDEDSAAFHPPATAAVGGAHLATDISVNPDQSSGHFRANPVRCVSVNLDRAAFHAGTEVHARVPMDRDAAVRHAAANPLHLRQIPVQFEPVALFTLDIEEITQQIFAIAHRHREYRNLIPGSSAEIIGRKHFGFDRQARRFPQPTLPMAPG